MQRKNLSDRSYFLSEKFSIFHSKNNFGPKKSFHRAHFERSEKQPVVDNGNLLCAPLSYGFSLGDSKRRKYWGGVIFRKLDASNVPKIPPRRCAFSLPQSSRFYFVFIVVFINKLSYYTLKINNLCITKTDYLFIKTAGEVSHNPCIQKWPIKENNLLFVFNRVHYRLKPTFSNNIHLAQKQFLYQNLRLNSDEKIIKHNGFISRPVCATY